MVSIITWPDIYPTGYPMDDGLARLVAIFGNRTTLSSNGHPTKPTSEKIACSFKPAEFMRFDSVAQIRDQWNIYLNCHVCKMTIIRHL